MKMTYVYIVLIIALGAGIYFVKKNSDGAPPAERVTKYDTFAQCLGDAGAKFYGAYWCPHCQEQKRLFGNSIKLPYIECSTPNGEAQTQICIDAKISGYPTWEFSDGSRLDTVQSLQALSEKTGCALPTA